MNTFFIFAIGMVLFAIGYGLGRSDGKVEGRIESFKASR